MRPARLVWVLALKRHRDLGAAAFGVLAVLCRHTNEVSGLSHVTPHQLRTELGASESTVKEGLTELRNKNLVQELPEGTNTIRLTGWHIPLF